MISMLIILFKYEDYRFFLVNFVNDEWYLFINVYFGECLCKEIVYNVIFFLD